MFILHADEKFYTSRCEKISDEGGCTISRHSTSSAPSKPIARLHGNETVLSDGFNEHSVILPDGCRVRITKDGTIHVTEANGVPRKVRYGGEAAKNIIK